MLTHEQWSDPLVVVVVVVVEVLISEVIDKSTKK